MIPGLLCTFFIAILACLLQSAPFWPFTVSGTTPHPIDKIIIAIVLGASIASFTDSKKLQKGIHFSVKHLLSWGIAFVGARLNFSILMNFSISALFINILCVFFAYFSTVWICRAARIDQQTTTLLGIGTAICGGTAIVAASRVINARAQSVSLSISTITVFGTIAIFAYPFIGEAIGLTDVQFGVWAGSAIHAIAQVLGAGFAFSEQAAETALVVKLVRILLLVPWIIILSLQQKKSRSSYPIFSLIPKFIFGFLFLSFLASIQAIPKEVQALLKMLSSFLITMGMAAVGLQTNIVQSLKAGKTVLLCGLASSILLGLFSIVIISIFML